MMGKQFKTPPDDASLGGYNAKRLTPKATVTCITCVWLFGHGAF